MGQPENFIPWEQIEPLVKPGMTPREFTAAILSAAGLRGCGYALQIMPSANDLPFGEAIKHGVRVFKAAELARYEVITGTIA